MTRTHTLLRLLPVAAAALFLAGSAHAQRPGGFGGPPMPPEMQAKMKAWETWRGTHKNVSALQRTLGGMTRLEDSPATRLTRPQAKTVLAVLAKWQSKPSITDAQAKQITAQLLAPLSAAQRQQLTQPGRPGGFGGGGRLWGRQAGRRWVRRGQTGRWVWRRSARWGRRLQPGGVSRAA